MKTFTNSKVADIKNHDKIKWKELSDIKQTPDQKSLETSLRWLFDTYFSFFRKFVFPEYIRSYKDKRLYTGDRYLMLKKLNNTEKSNIKYPLVSTIHDTYLSNTYDTETSIKAIPNDESDMDKAKVAKMFIEWWMSAAKWESVVKMMENEAVLIWPWYWKTWFCARDEELIYVKDGKEITSKFKNIHPTIKYVDVFSMLFNPFSEDFYTSNKFVRNIMTVQEAMKIYSGLIELKEEERYVIQSKWVPFSTVDYKKVRFLKWYEEEIRKECNQCNDWAMDVLIDRYFTDEMFAVDFKNEMIEVIEYREPNSWKMVIFCQWIMLFDWSSPYPIQWDPYVRLVFKDEPWLLFPQWLWQQLEPIQKNVDAFVNNRIDAVSMMVNPWFIADKWVFWPDTPEVLKIRWWKVYERVMNKLIETIKLVDPWAVNSLLQWIQFYISQAYEIAKLNSYTQWGAGKVERTAGWVQQRVQVLKTALIPFYNSKNQTLTKIAENRMWMARVYMPKDFTVRIMWPEDTVQFEKITSADLASKMDFVYDNQSLKSISRKEERDDIVSALQYVQDPMTRLVLEWRLLWTFDVNAPRYEDKVERATEQAKLNAILQWQPQQPQWIPQAPQGMPQGIPQWAQEEWLESVSDIASQWNIPSVMNVDWFERQIQIQE